MPAKQTKRAVKETPTAVKAKGATSLTPLGETDDLGTSLVPMPKASALSLDVGMIALRDASAIADDETQINQLAKGMTDRRGRAQVALAIAFHKAASHDKGIDLSVSLLNVKEHKSEKNRLGKQLWLAIGLMETKAGKTTWTPEARAMQFEVPGDDKSAIDHKKSVRANFSAMATKAQRVALHALENGIKMERDDTTGLLRLTDGKGKTAVKSHFGEASVLLNEDQNILVTDKKGETAKKKLKAKPSFTEIGRKVGENHGLQIVARKDSRMQTTPLDPIKDLIERCSHMVMAIGKLPADKSKELTAALESLRNAIDVAIG